MQPSLQPDEQDRLRAVRRCEPALGRLRPVLHRLTAVLARLLEADAVCVTVVDGECERSWAGSGMALDQPVPREFAPGARAILSDRLYLVPDLAVYPRSRCTPLWREARFLAAIPLHAPTGHRIGTISVMDLDPRGFDAAAEESLLEFAQLVEGLLADSFSGGALDPEIASDFLLTQDLGGRIVAVSDSAPYWTGYSRHDLLGMRIEQLLRSGTPEAPSQWLELHHAHGHSVRVRTACRMVWKQGAPDGLEILVSLPAATAGEEVAETELRIAAPLPVPVATPWLEPAALGEDLRAAAPNAELLDRDRNRVLAMVARDEPLSEVLTQLARMVDSQSPGSLSAILLLQGDRLVLGAAPGLPRGFQAAVEALPPGVESGGCASAAWLGVPVVVDDLRKDPLWKRHRAAAIDLNLVCGTGTPILSRSGQALGALVTYHSRRRRTDEEKLLAMVANMAAITIELRQLDEQLAYQARHDYLSGLPNRVFLNEQLELALGEVSSSGQKLAVFILDIDRFKPINDSFGHDVGDDVLRQIGARLRDLVSDHFLLARMGDDEFAIVKSRLSGAEEALRFAETLLDELRVPFLIGGRELFLTASIGVSIAPEDGTDVAALLRSAGAAVYQAKNSGKNMARRFEPDFDALAVARLEMENFLRRALENSELDLTYQPQTDLNGALGGMEALLVWRHPKLGRISPRQFIPIAEETGMIIGIGTWVIRQACHQNARWQAAGLPKLKVAVNVSPLQFGQPDFVEVVADALRQSGLEPRFLELELTESLVMSDIDESARRMARLRMLGVSIAIDDFGTGYSSLSYLRRLPLDTLKIDQSFLREIDYNPAALPLIANIIQLAHKMGLCVVAEGVESARQLEHVRMVGCDQAQGHLFGEPLDVEQMQQRLAAWHSCQPGERRPGVRAAAVSKAAS